MRLEPELLHPSLAPFFSELTRETNLDGIEMPRPQRLVAEALVALLGSARLPEEMEDYAHRLNGVLDAEARYRTEDRTEDWTRLMEHLSEAKAYAVHVKTAQSGMACGNALMGLDYALDEARELIAGTTTVPTSETPTGVDEPKRLVEEILASLDRSARTKAKKLGYAHELNAALDADPNLSDSRSIIDALQRVKGAAQALETSLTASTEKVALDYFELTLEVMHAAIKGKPLEPSGYRFR